MGFMDSLKNVLNERKAVTETGHMAMPQQAKHLLT